MQVTGADRSNCDEGDCNAAGTDDEEERDVGDDADDSDVEPNSRRKGYRRPERVSVGTSVNSS